MASGTRSANRLEAIRSALETARKSWGETGEVLLDSGAAYGDGEQIRILVRKRSHRYDLSDDGVSVGKARRPQGWLELAEKVVAEDGMNVNRRGAVFVPAVEGRDLASLALRLADTCLAVYGELLDADAL